MLAILNVDIVDLPVAKEDTLVRVHRVSENEKEVYMHSHVARYELPNGQEIRFGVDQHEFSILN